jgi:hypothetical protein
VVSLNKGQNWKNCTKQEKSNSGETIIRLHSYQTPGEERPEYPAREKTLLCAPISVLLLHASVKHYVNFCAGNIAAIDTLRQARKPH